MISVLKLYLLGDSTGRRPDLSSGRPSDRLLIFLWGPPPHDNPTVRSKTPAVSISFVAILWL